MRRLAHFASRSPRLNLRTKTNGRASENSVKLKPIVRRDRSILPRDAWETIAKSLRISDRELEIVQGIFDDRKEFAIADELKISMHTVHTHLERLYRKLGVSSRLGLVLCILSEYLSSLPPTF
jgi:ATP/maltotriose-dependent transcriptional regulator MalT